MENILYRISCVKVLIDHHQQPETEAFDYGISDVSKSSTCEMVYDFIHNSPNRSLLNSNIATCLYTGILTDTGSFRFPSATANVHEVAAALKETGIDHTAILRIFMIIFRREG